MTEASNVLRRRRRTAPRGVLWQAAESLEQRRLFAVSAPWVAADVGSMTGRTAGSSDYNATTGQFTVRGSGTDIFGTADEFHFAYQTFTGDVEIIARLDSFANASGSTTSKGGLMFRTDLTAGSKHYMATHYPNPDDPFRMLARTTTGSGTFAQQDDNAFAGGTVPRYLKLQRLGTKIAAYSSADQQAWYALGGGIDFDLGATIHVGMAVTSKSDPTLNTATFSDVVVRAPQLDYRTSYIGNSFAGGGKHMPQSVDAMYVNPTNGNIYLSAEADEGEGEGTILDANGNFIANLQATHGFSREGGFAITASASYIYVGQQQGHVNAAGYPPSGTTWYAVRRYNLTGSPAPFTGGSGYDGSMLVINTTADVQGLAINSANELFVSDPSSNQVKVYNGSTMTAIRTFALARPRDIALATDGNLWIIQAGDGGANAPAVLKYSTTGVYQNVQITGLSNPTAIAVNPNDGKVYVTDDGAAYRQVRIFNSNGTPAGTLGQAGGLYSGTSGAVLPTKFHGLTGVGVDAGGNVVVVNSGWRITKEGTGTELRKFNGSGVLQWERFGLEFVDNADFDPASPDTVYTKTTKYAMNYAAPNGQQWTYAAMTLDPYTYPSDFRANIQSTQQATAVVRRLGAGNAKFLFVSEQNGTWLAVYRFNAGSEIAIPTAVFTRERKNSAPWITNQPASGGWTWVDADADGQMDAGEYATTAQRTDVFGYQVDDAGNVWRAQEGGAIEKYAFTSVAANGVPQWNTTPVSYVRPSVFTSVTRAYYDPANDVMFLGGYTTARPKVLGEFAHVGSEIMRFNNWSTATNDATRAPAWRTGSALPYSSSTYDAPNIIKAMSEDGDYVFAMNLRQAQVYVIRKSDGTIADVLTTGVEVAGRSGWIDAAHGVNARQRANGEYLIFAEEVEDAKVLMYRWGQATPLSLAATAPSNTSINLTWQHDGANETGFTIERSANGTTGWASVGTAAENATSFLNSGLSAGTTYHYRVRATNGASASADSNVASATTPTGVQPLSRVGWIATASHQSGNAGLAIDADTGSRWDSAVNQVAGMYWQADMGVVQTVRRVVFTSGAKPSGLYAVRTSLDGINWTTVATGGGAATNDKSFTPVSARFIRIELTQAQGRSWHLFDFNVYA